MNFLFKTTTYLLVWKKFKKEIIGLIVSIGLIAFIDGVYNDLFVLLKIQEQKTVIMLLFVKWFLILLIVVYNIFNFKKIKKINQTNIQQNTKQIPLNHQNVLSKEKLKTKTDLILQKYLKDKDV